MSGQAECGQGEGGLAIGGRAVTDKAATKKRQRGTHSGKARGRSTAVDYAVPSRIPVSTTTTSRVHVLKLGKECPMRCKPADCCSKARALGHFRNVHQPFKCRFQCKCGRQMPADLKDETRHLRTCYPAQGHPALEFWELSAKTYEGVAAYGGEVMTLDPYTYYSLLIEPANKPSRWIASVLTFWNS